MHIIVLSGGSSRERDISLRSGAAVAAALQTAGHQVSEFDPAAWPADYSERLRSADVVFPVLHGRGGEDGTIQQLLDELGVAYVGADIRASAICFDKWLYKQVLQTAKLSVSPGWLVDGQLFMDKLPELSAFVLKPRDEGSSVDTLIVRDSTAFDAAEAAAIFAQRPEMLLEPLAAGSEITVAVVGDQPLPVIEIIPPADAEFDYDNKYNGRTQELCPPHTIAAAVQQIAQELALQIHQLLDIRDLSRTDMIVGPDGSLTVLETNTMPGLTDQSLLPKAAAQAGLDMPALCDRLVQLASARRSPAGTAAS